ncbi:MAG: thiamine pyrophosphate-binding protein [Desulfohalobiaceae bacterium]|nr:thiamine pyrophosphate-binding protein [Desulfohalobiaceae bacterium]
MSTLVSQTIAQFLKLKGVQLIYGLCGGHIQPLWDELFEHGIRIIDVRDERAAVHMAQAQGELSGCPGVALLTAGPGFTNGLTGLANAYVSRAPVLVLSCIPPRPQLGLGALQEIPQAEMVKPVTRYACSVRHTRLVGLELEKGFDSCLGLFCDPGPAYLDFPVDLLREPFPGRLQDRPSHTGTRHTRPLDAEIEATAGILASSRRPLIISGKGARGAGSELQELIEAWNCLYLDTVESRGLVSEGHPAFVPAVRGKVMQEADMVLTVGRNLDYQLGYGSSAVFPRARLVRIGASPFELGGNRPGERELFGSVPQILKDLTVQIDGLGTASEQAWIEDLRTANAGKLASLFQQIRHEPLGEDGDIHPRYLLARLKEHLHAEAVVIADGGDILSFCRLLLTGATYLDCGSFGCLGVGVPYGVAAGLLYPERQVVVISGDGAFGFNAMELDTCVRHRARVLFVVANNRAWNIERNDQLRNYQGRIMGSELEGPDYADLARSLGLHAQRVSDPDDLPGAIERGLAHLPALLDVRISREVLSPDGLSGLARVPDYQPLDKWDTMERKQQTRTLGS